MTDESLHHLSLHALDEALANYLNHLLLLRTALDSLHLSSHLFPSSVQHAVPSLNSPAPSSSILSLFNSSTLVTWSSIYSLGKVIGVVSLKEERTCQEFFSLLSLLSQAFLQEDFPLAFANQMIQLGEWGELPQDKVQAFFSSTGPLWQFPFSL